MGVIIIFHFAKNHFCHLHVWNIDFIYVLFEWFCQLLNKLEIILDIFSWTEFGHKVGKVWQDSYLTLDTRIWPMPLYPLWISSLSTLVYKNTSDESTLHCLGKNLSEGLLGDIGLPCPLRDRMTTNSKNHNVQYFMRLPKKL